MHKNLRDQAGNVRSGEELDSNSVDHYLKAILPDLQGAPNVTQFPSGASNLTYHLQYANRDLVLRRPPLGTKAKSAHDMGREFKVMHALKPVFPYVPAMLAHCEDTTIIGAEFYVMERLEGIILRFDFPKTLSLDAQQVETLCKNVLDKLIVLHQIDPDSAGLSDLGKGSGYTLRQVEGWSRRYVNARTDNAASFEAVMAWLSDKRPEDRKRCIIHNDYRFDNVVLNPENPLEVIGVLDWEMATIGDPLMDLGNSLAYWVQQDDDPVFQMSRRQPTHQPGMLTRKQVVDYYEERSGIGILNFDFYEVYGLFRLAVIAQQIYYRFHHGQTQDQRFAEFVHFVNYLEKRCLKLIDQSSL